MQYCKLNYSKMLPAQMKNLMQLCTTHRLAKAWRMLVCLWSDVRHYQVLEVVAFTREDF
jgi:hypothetical protein